MTSARTTYRVELRQLATQPAAVIHETVEMADLGEWMGKVFGEVEAYLREMGVAPAGPPFSRYFSMPDDGVDVESGFPTATTVARRGRITPTELPGGSVAVTTHMGPYETVSAAYEAIGQWLVEQGRHPAGPFWEVYYTDPTEVPDPSQWRTDVFQPLAPEA